MTSTVKQHDNYPPLSFALTDINGPINLTSATQVQIFMKSPTVLVSGVCTVTNAPLGLGVYNWAAGDTAFVGTYQIEWQITWGGGKIQTVPSDSTLTLNIIADLGP